MQQRRLWLPTWVPLGLVVGGGILAVCLIGPSTPEAKAEPFLPKGTAVFQTADKIVVSVPLPERKQAEPLTVEVCHVRKPPPAAHTQKQVEGPAGKAENARVELAGLKRS